MLTAIAVFTVLALGGQGTVQQADTNLPANKLVSKMLQYYSDATTMTGTITYTASDGKGKSGVQTTLQFERPSKLYIRQVKIGGGLEWLVTSDGKNFSYNLPGHLIETQNQRLVESVKQVDGEYDIRRVYSVAAFGSLGDRSIPLDIAIGRREDLQHDILQWATVEDNGKRAVEGAEVRSITGAWRPYGEAATEGQYELNILPDGQLKRYALSHPYRLPDGSQVNLVEVWDVNLVVNGKPDQLLFNLVK